MLLRVISYRLNLFAFVWLLLIATSFGWLFRYQSMPGEVTAAPSQWPSGVRIVPKQDCFNLVVFLHPRCPCSRATLNELSRTLARCPANFNVQVLVWKPSSAALDWTKTDIFHSAELLPSCSIHVDEDGRDAEQFGAATSGHMVLFGKSGELLFSGGITSLRGHEGANPASDALRSLLLQESTAFCSYPVYGCPFSPSNRSDS